jgi:V/A-type H+-transporting ATPase subunit C
MIPFDPVTISLLIVSLVVLLVVIFFFSYFNTLLLIANFTYPNAKIKATGAPFIRKSTLEKLVESGAREEFIEVLRSERYPISSGEIDMKSIEKAINRETFGALESTLFSLPNGAKPFFEAYMMRYDAEAVKKVIRAKRTGKKPDMDGILLYSLDNKVIEGMLEAENIEDAKAYLQETAFAKAAEERDGFSFETAVDRAVLKSISESISEIDSSISKPIRRFVGVLADIMNIKMVLRAKNMGLSGETIMKLIFPEGLEIAEWRLKNMAEAPDVAGAIAELSGTSYSEMIKGVSTVDGVESALDRALLKVSADISMENSLYVGPAIFFFVSKEMEARNLRVVSMAIEHGLSWDDVEDLMVTEVEN